MIRKRIAEAFGITSLNDSNPEEIMNIFIDKLNGNISNIEFKNKATSTTDLINLDIDNILNDTRLSDKEKLTIPMELKEIIDKAVERNYLSKINVVEVKSLLRKMKKDETSEVYSSAIDYLKYGITFPIGSKGEKKINKIIHEVENPSVKHRILNFFMDMKYKILKLYNKLF